MRSLLKFVLIITYVIISSINNIHAQEVENERTKPLLDPTSLRVDNYRDKELPDTPAANLLTAWLKAHNTANRDSLGIFVKIHYSEKLLVKTDFGKHVDFYSEATKMYGKLRAKPFRIEKNEKHSIIAWFLKEGLDLREASKPENVVVVEVDVDTEDTNSLRRGIGMAALICNLREESRQ